MTDKEMVEVLDLCHPIYKNLQDKIGYKLNEKEMTLLGKFKVIWEDDLSIRPGLIKRCGLSYGEIAFLSGYVYYSHQMVIR